MEPIRRPGHFVLIAACVASVLAGPLARATSAGEPAWPQAWQDQEENAVSRMKLVAAGEHSHHGAEHGSHGAPRSVPAPVCRGTDMGVMILAHGSHTGDEWNQTLSEIRESLSEKYTVEMAFGMADGTAMQQSVDRLKSCRVARIVVIPLFASSYSGLIDHTAYLLGIRKQPSKSFLDALDLPETQARWQSIGMPEMFEHMKAAARVPVQVGVPIQMTSALDADPLVAEILADRASAMSRNPGRESLVLIGHGPNEEENYGLWLNMLQTLAEQVRQKLHLHEARVAVLRDDAPAGIREKATQDMRRMVGDLSRSTDVLVIPHLLARGGVEDRVRKALEGLSYEWTGETLAPHPNLIRWVEKQIAAAQSTR